MKLLHNMTRGEIIRMLNAKNQNVPPRVRQFLAEILDSHVELEELPEFLQSLSRAAEAIPADLDGMDLSWRQLMAATGVEVPAEFNIPGVTELVENAIDRPLRELEKFIGPAEMKFHLEQLDHKLDAENSAALIAVAERYRFD